MMNVEIYKRGESLFKKGDSKMFNFFVLNGVVNGYDDNMKNRGSTPIP